MFYDNPTISLKHSKDGYKPDGMEKLYVPALFHDTGLQQYTATLPETVTLPELKNLIKTPFPSLLTYNFYAFGNI
ncbi:hypothetical protein F4782DRAFT_527246 [Xylaria castorea]|nr:hypothetical protein F4782DRAFT_527246 [Xylaria castorea]